MLKFPSRTSPVLCSFLFMHWTERTALLHQIQGYEQQAWAEAASGSLAATSATDPAYAGLQILGNSQIPSFLLAQNFQQETRNILGKSGLMTALRLYEFNHITAQAVFPHHTGCVHSLCLSKNLVPLVVQHNKRELGIQRKICQRLCNRKPSRVVWRMMKRTLEWIAHMSLNAFNVCSV